MKNKESHSKFDLLFTTKNLSLLIILLTSTMYHSCTLDDGSLNDHPVANNWPYIEITQDDEIYLSTSIGPPVALSDSGFQVYTSDLNEFMFRLEVHFDFELNEENILQLVNKSFSTDENNEIVVSTCFFEKDSLGRTTTAKTCPKSTITFTETSYDATGSCLNYSSWGGLESISCNQASLIGNITITPEDESQMSNTPFIRFRLNIDRI